VDLENIARRNWDRAAKDFDRAFDLDPYLYTQIGNALVIRFCIGMRMDSKFCTSWKRRSGNAGLPVSSGRATRSVEPLKDRPRCGGMRTFTKIQNLTERVSLQFRAEAFNVLNHTNLNGFQSTRLGSSRVRKNRQHA